MVPLSSSNHQQLRWVFNSLFWLTITKHWSSALLTLCEANPLMTSGLHKQTRMWKLFPSCFFFFFEETDHVITKLHSIMPCVSYPLLLWYRLSYQTLLLSDAISWCQTSWSTMVNSLAPGRSECDSKNVIFNLVYWLISSHDNALWWMPQDFTDGKSTLV